MRRRYAAKPHPHLVIDEIVPPDAYAAMSFPDHLVAPGAAWGITSSDAQCAEVLRDPNVITISSHVDVWPHAPRKALASA